LISKDENIKNLNNEIIAKLNNLDNKIENKKTENYNNNNENIE
jgi:hypothetical protein